MTFQSSTNVTREVTLDFDPTATTGDLVTALNQLIARPAIGADSVIQQIRGGQRQITLVITKPDA
jgi:hypothetical protein